MYGPYVRVVRIVLSRAGRTVQILTVPLILNKRISYCRETARRAMPVEISSTAAQPYEKSHFTVMHPTLGASPWRSLKVIHRNCHISLLIRYNVSILHTVSEILTLLPRTWLPVTLKSPSVPISQLKIQATCALRFTCKQNVANTCCIFRRTRVRKVSTNKTKVTFKVTQAKSLPLELFDIGVALWLRLSISYTVSEILYSYLPKFKDVTWPWTRPIWRESTMRIRP